MNETKCENEQKIIILKSNNINNDDSDNGEKNDATH